MSVFQILDPPPCSRKIPRFSEVDGFRLPPTFDPEIFRDACRFKPKRDEVVVVTYPKCGTTWTMQIVSLILRNGLPAADAKEYFSIQPFAEMTPLKRLENLRKGSCIKTHLPFDRINFSEDSKYIYVARHPADCVVSFYHHMRHFPIYFFSDGTFDDFFEIFVTGKTEFGDYFDNLLSWYERKDEPNVFFMTFEALKSDPKRMILRIAEFLGEDYYKNLRKDDDKVLKKVLEYSSMEYMKNTVDKFWDKYSFDLTLEKDSPAAKNETHSLIEAMKAGHYSVGKFIRKGKVGDGKFTLSKNQIVRLENRMKEKGAESIVMNLWKNYDNII